MGWLATQRLKYGYGRDEGTCGYLHQETGVLSPGAGVAGKGAEPAVGVELEGVPEGAPLDAAVSAAGPAVAGGAGASGAADAAGSPGAASAEVGAGGAGGGAGAAEGAGPGSGGGKRKRWERRAGSGRWRGGDSGSGGLAAPSGDSAADVEG